MSFSSDVIILYPTELDRDFDTHLAKLGFGVNPSMLHRMYRRAALRLNTLSDLQLAAKGIRRCDIPAYVMRDRFPAFAEQHAIPTANR